MRRGGCWVAGRGLYIPLAVVVVVVVERDCFLKIPLCFFLSLVLGGFDDGTIHSLSLHGHPPGVHGF
jgi:hypothetical protein